MHLDAEQVERLLAAELAPAAAGAATDHLAACHECRVQVQQAQESERRIHAQLAALDHPTRQPELSVVLGGVGVREIAWRRWAATIVLAVALGGVAYATPVAGLRSLLQALLSRPGVPAPVVRDSVAVPAAAAVAPADAGIALPPGRRLAIVFTGATSGASARVALSDGNDVVIRAPAGAATFSSKVDRVLVHILVPTMFAIEVPRSAPRVEVRRGSRSTFLKVGDTITAATVADSAGPWVLPLEDGR